MQKICLPKDLTNKADAYSKDTALNIVSKYKKAKILKRKKVEYYNIPVAFDIEFSSFYNNGQKVSIMYEWTFSINGEVIYGRFWKDFLELCKILSNQLDLSPDRHLIIYVHNLSCEFQFIRKLFEWDNVFALKERKVCYAITKTGIEFRCSLLLSGYSLANLAKQLNKFKIRKLVGDLDYNKIRTPITPLTDKELGYCINDVQIIIAYITELIIRDKGIVNIQLTKTGYVRKFCRDSCYYGFGKKSKSGISGV